MKRDDVAAFLDGLTPAAREIVVAIREVVRRVAPEAEETLLWGGLSYHRPAVGGRVKGAVCQISCKVGVVRLDFIHGIRLSDPHRRLTGDRRSKRFLVVGSVLDAEHPHVAELIRDAASQDPTSWT